MNGIRNVCLSFLLLFFLDRETTSLQIQTKTRDFAERASQVRKEAAKRVDILFS